MSKTGCTWFCTGLKRGRSSEKEHRLDSSVDKGSTEAKQLQPQLASSEVCVLPRAPVTDVGVDIAAAQPFLETLPAGDKDEPPVQHGAVVMGNSASSAGVTSSGDSPHIVSTQGSLATAETQSQQEAHSPEHEPATAASSVQQHSSNSSSGAGSDSEDGPAQSKGPPSTRSDTATGTHRCPPHGAKAIIGRRSKMEDAYKAVPYLLQVPIHENSTSEERVPPRVAVHLQQAPANSPNSYPPPSGASASSGTVQAYRETFHFFGVFDGHGGDAAAQYCSTILHERIAEALSDKLTGPTSTAQSAAVSSCSARSAGSNAGGAVEQAADAVPTTALPLRPNSAQVLPALADAALCTVVVGTGEQQRPQSSGAEGSAGAGNNGGAVYNAQMIEDAITDAFCKTDEAFGKDENANLVGTTAVVALVGSRQLYVANCGDSRAVLCRNGTAFPLTDDHKAAREDETARIEKEGGQILFWNGVRVMGVLAVSRAIGDHCLRPYVIAKPEVTILERRKDDELLLLASDGLWDVLSNQEAVSLAKRCLQRAHVRGANRETAARIAATVLTRAAVDRGSRDNVTVVVVDLTQTDTSDGTMEAVEAPMDNAGAIVEAGDAAVEVAPDA